MVLLLVPCRCLCIPYGKADKLMVYKLVLVCLALSPRCCRLGGLLDFCSVVLCRERVKSLSGHIREREHGIPRKGDAGSLQVWQALPALESAFIPAGCCSLPSFPACVWSHTRSSYFFVSLHLVLISDIQIPSLLERNAAFVS